MAGSDDKKKRPVGKIVAIVGALAGLASAIVPAWLAYLDNSEERAQEQAQEATDHAQKSEEKAELAYELLRQQITFMTTQIDELKTESDDHRDVLVDIRVRLAEIAQQGSQRVQPRARPLRASGGGSGAYGEPVEALDDPLACEEEEGAEDPWEVTEAVQVQAQLPIDLEEEWARSKEGD